MRFEVLGQLRVSEGGRQLALGPREQQRVLALLLANPDGLSADRLVDELLGETPPPSAHHMMQVYVSRLRAVMAAADPAPRIVLRGSRYVLRVEPGELDADDLVEGAARAGEQLDRDLGAARSTLVVLEGLWRGQPYDGLADESPLLRAEVARLEQCYLHLVSDRVATDLALGRHAEVVPDLERLTAAHPYVEPLWYDWMLALHRCRRGAEALRVAQQLRALLLDDLGVEPSPPILELERRIVDQDPTLQWEPPPPLTNLPVPVTSFVGRGEDVATARHLVETSRLVTLTGPGGIGKTRLAIEVATQLRPRFPDGVWWIDLASTLEPGRVVPEVARVIGVGSSPGSVLLDSVVRSLARKRALLVLDNCEHLAPAVADVVGAVLSCPNVHVLVTSRTPLHLSSETRWVVRGLAATTPSSADPDDFPDAVRLFVERAAGASPRFALTPDDLDPVAELCRRLDGMPLAIEMAAGSAGTLSIDELLHSLDDRFRLLQRSISDADDRHRTLDAVLGWSYDQLPPVAQHVFDRLGVFVGAFDLAAAGAVTFETPALLDVADVLAQLVDASMVTAERSGGRPRFRLLETVRDYAARHLLARGELEATRQLHADHYLSMLANAGELIRTPAFAPWVPRIAEAYPEIRQALAWSLLRQPYARALGSAAALFEFWYRTGDPREAERWGTAMLERSEGVAPGSVGAAHMCVGFAADILLRPDVLLDHATRAIELYRLAGDHRGVVRGLFARASAALQLGDVGLAISSSREALAICDEHDDRWGRAGPLAELAIAYGFFTGDLPAALIAGEEAAALHRELGDLAGQVVLNVLPKLALMSGEFDVAERHARLIDAATVGTGWEAAGATVLGEVLTVRGQLDAAGAAAERGLRRALDTGQELWFRLSLRNLARIAARGGDLVRAAVLIGASRTNMPQYGLEPAIYDEIESACRNGLSVERADALMTQGGSTPHERLVELALEEPLVSE